MRKIKFYSITCFSLAFGAFAASSASPEENDRPTHTAVASLSILPDEITQHIFSFLPPADILRSSQVCNHWQSVGNDESLWQDLYKKQSLEPVAGFTLSERGRDLDSFIKIKACLNNDQHDSILPLIDRAIQQGSLAAIKARWEVELNKKPEDRAASIKNLTEVMVQQEVEEALLHKIEGLIQGKYGYDKNLQEAHSLIEAGAAQSKEWALIKKSEGLAFGRYGYEENRKAARRLIEAQAGQGKWWALIKMKGGQIYGRYGNYGEGPLPEVRSLIEARAAQGEDWALNERMRGLAYGFHGYEKNPTAAYSLIEAQAAQGKEWALIHRIRGLASGRYGYEKNLQAAHSLIEAGAAQSKKWAFSEKISGLMHGMNGYEKNPAAALGWAYLYQFARLK